MKRWLQGGLAVASLVVWAIPLRAEPLKVGIIGTPPFVMQNGAQFGGVVRSIDDVLDADRHAVKGSRGKALTTKFIRRARLFECLVRVEMLPGSDAGFQLVDASETGLDQVDG